eukprot:TRINITY_DN3179_c0_g4_i1.p1 TRINITY_DN3179_c0_g4~~TRINITY_DN3179_c0_g4_i1.p1  ORF type:complete len:839 (-),score=173.92 TRINITY_DN3179_c0_g4_i1:173-2689(-)
MSSMAKIMYPVRLLITFAAYLVKLVLVAYCCLRAYRIRLHAVNTYGMIIHEFDPWFNYRATEYLAANGAERFFKWYDYMSWYPIGRPIGTTIYPGMQFASVWIWRVLDIVPKQTLKMPKEYLAMIPQWLLPYLPYSGKKLVLGPMSLNDVCVMVPAWFGALATFMTFNLASELSGSSGVGVVAAGIMAIIPAHMMRSCAGEFDNEAVAVALFIGTLYLWARCVRNSSSWPIALPAGIMYFFAAATWGGYIFINNLIALHVVFIVVMGKYSGVYLQYTIFYLVGTLCSMQIPVIGTIPIRSVEQLPSVLVFGTLQIMQICEIYRNWNVKKLKKGKVQPMDTWTFIVFRAGVFVFIALAALAVAYVLSEMGFFMPLGARIRGLFLEAVKTGNPLVDSVAEHQPSNEQAYESFLGKPRYLAVVGLLFCWHQRSPAKWLAVIYAAVAYHYSLKMSRLMLICGPIVSVLAAFPVGLALDWCFEQAVRLICGPAPEAAPEVLPERAGGMGSIWRFLGRRFGKVVYPVEIDDAIAAKEAFADSVWFVDRPVRILLAAFVVLYGTRVSKQPVNEFIQFADMMAQHMSEPHLAFQARDGRIIDDYLRGYEWLKANTPEDARVMAWWDYGYQITGVANRTSIADGNTWNHEHIATLGRIMTSTEQKSHKAMRHIADYALVWAGGQGDDMGKSPHLARIGNSVFPDHCGDDDPLCRKFGFYQDGSPTPMMANSFLYKAVNHNMQQGVRLNGKYFKEVHTTKHGLMRIFKVMNVSEESKEWIADPKNRVCDAPGSWYCVGQYPPALAPLISKRRNFAQLEDFNKKDGQKSAYTKLIEEERQGKSSRGDED